jgi:hypothetical protein
MATITQNVESFDKITVTITASSGSTVSFVSETGCTVTPKATKTSPAVFIITGFSGSSYTASFTDESAGTLDVTGSVSSTGGWISDTEQFVMRAEYNSQPVDLKYTVVKSKDGDVGVDGIDGATGVDSKAVKLTASKYVISYSTAGTESDTIIFTATPQNPPAGVNYRFTIGGVEKQYLLNGTATYTLDQADEPAIGSTTTVVCEMRSGGSPDDILATDSVTIYAVQDGSDAIIGFLTNVAHVVAADSSGNVPSFTGAGGIYKVFVGGTDVTTNCAFSVSSSTNVTTTINATSGVYDITAIAADTATATYQAIIPAAFAGTQADVTITADYTIAKSTAGAAGKQVTNGTVFLTVPQSSPPSAPTATAYNFGTQTFTGLTANWSLERPTISAGNANNFWEAAFNVEETTAGGGTGVPTFQNPPVKVQDGFGDSITENVIDINAASTKWIGVDNISFTEDATNAVQPRSSSEYKYTYNATGGSEEYAVGAANTDKGWLSTTHTFYAGDTAVANIIIRHIAEPFPVGGVQDTQKIKSVYYEFEVVGSPASTYSTESNYSISLNGTTLTQSWVGGGSPVANTYDQIQDYDQATADQAYIITIQHTPTNAVKSVFVQYSGIVDSNITIDGGNYGK